MQKIGKSTLALILCLSLFAINSSAQQLTDTQETASCKAKVDMLSFKIKVEKEKSLVSWISLAESNLQYYVLERSVDNNDFLDVTRVQAAVESQSIIRYKVTDVPKAESSVVYRLRIVDYEGNSRHVNAVQMVEEQIFQLASQ